MLFKDLLERQGIECPKWIAGTLLGDEWQTSIYQLEAGIHTWTVDNEFQHLKITWDDLEYKFEGLDDKGNKIYTEVRRKDGGFVT